MEVYDEYISRVDWSTGQSLQRWLSLRIYRELRRYIKFSGGLSFLEVGPGVGNFARAVLTERENTYQAIEPNKTLRHLVQSITEVEIHPFSLPEYPPLLRNTHDVVVAINVLEHAESSYQARRWLVAMSEMVKPGGHIFIFSPDISSFKTFFWEIDWQHCFPSSNRAISELAVDVGLRIERSVGFRLGRTSPISNFCGFILSKITPTRLLDFISNRLFGRYLGSGLQVALFWKSSFVILAKE